VSFGVEFDSVLGAARLGEEWAVTALYEAVQPSLLRWLRSRAGSDADDVASQTWLEVANGLARFEGGEDGFRGWVFTIARRRLADERRRRRRRPTTAQLPDDIAASEDSQAAIDGDDAVRRILGLLPPEEAEILLLRVVGGLPAEQVALVVGKRAGTVRVIQHRALQRLAEKIGDPRNDRTGRGDE
jgi:RNA polymerase sigma-70 factor (ECF subfamily)